MSKDSEVSRREFLRRDTSLIALREFGLAAPGKPVMGAELPNDQVRQEAVEPRGWVPQTYAIERDEAAGKLTLSTRYYTIEHDLKKGGCIARIRYTHGKASDLLLRPMGASVRLRKSKEPSLVEGRQFSEEVFTDLKDPSPSVSTTKSGKWEMVSVQSAMLNRNAEDLGIRTETTYTYRWGHIKIHKEFHFPAGGIEVRDRTVYSMLLDPTLTHYGYMPNVFEDFSPNPWGGYESCFCGKIRAGTHLDVPFQTRYVPRYLVWANPGIEGIEWFVSDDLSQWDYQMAGLPGTGYALVGASTNPPGRGDFDSSIGFVT